MNKNQSNWISPFLGWFISLSLGCTGIGVAIWGEEISGGLPFLGSETNTLIGRVVFAAGGLLCIWISTIAFRELRLVLRKRSPK